MDRQRSIKNFIQAVLSGLCYAYAMQMWFPHLPHIVSAFVVAVSMTANIIDFQKDIKRELIVSAISIGTVTMFAEIMQASEDQWWQKENATAFVGAILIVSMDAIITEDEKKPAEIIKVIKDVIISVTNAIAIYKAINIKLPEVYAVCITCALALFINIDFDKIKSVKAYQVYMAFIFSAISDIVTLFVSIFVFNNIYWAFVFVIPIANVVYPFFVKIRKDTIVPISSDEKATDNVVEKNIEEIESAADEEKK